MNEQLLAVARQEVKQCRLEGRDDSDTLQYVIDACARYGRVHRMIGEDLSNEMRASLEQIAREAMRQEGNQA
jgi:hypothetical protein